MQRIISWNVASVRARMPVLGSFLRTEQPDFMFLQEIKATDETFPFMDFQIGGYRAVISGQKGYNGVAILGKEKLLNIKDTLTGFEDQARFIQAETAEGIVLISVYVPNGNPPEKNPDDTSRFEYKLRWMAALNDQVRTLINAGKKVVLGGDFNVIERDTDVYSPDVFRGGALLNDAVRGRYAELSRMCLVNGIRQFNPEPHTYSFWDFQGGAWPQNRGILLDALWVSPVLPVTRGKIYREVRGLAGASDHVPVGIEIG